MIPAEEKDLKNRFQKTLMGFNLSATRAEWFADAFTPVEFDRKEIITNEGQVENYMYFVFEGIQRSYYPKNGKEHVVAFSYPESLSGVPDSFVTRKPSPCVLEAITPSVMLRLHHLKLEEMLEESKSLTTFFLKGYQNLVVGLVNRQYELQSYSMEERFNVFYERSKRLINQIPRKDIASYLNMDPTNLSKLMAKLK